MIFGLPKTRGCVPVLTVLKNTKFIIDSVCKSKILPHKNYIQESQL
jgi:hypothetical protein